jgi:hypothetical protein
MGLALDLPRLSGSDIGLIRLALEIAVLEAGVAYGLRNDGQQSAAVLRMSLSVPGVQPTGTNAPAAGIAVLRNSKVDELPTPAHLLLAHLVIPAAPNPAA